MSNDKPFFTSDDFEDLPVSKETDGMMPSWDARTVADYADAKVRPLLQWMREARNVLRNTKYNVDLEQQAQDCLAKYPKELE